MRSDRIILVLVAALLLAILVYRSRPGRIDPAPAASVVSGAAGAVRVSGAVRHPGIYPVSANSMATGVILMAEPLKPLSEADVAYISAIPVESGDALELVIQPGKKVSITRGSIPAEQRLILGIALDINRMSEDDFDRVPGIGPAMARRIVEYRQNNGGIMSKKDLLFVEGIGEKKYSAMCRYFK